MQLSVADKEFIRLHIHDDVRILAMRASRYPEVNMPAAIVQIAGRQVAVSKIPSWHTMEELLYPRHLSMEQASSEPTARYKAELMSGETLTDLTGGFGIDCAFLSRQFKQTAYVERQTDLCEIASHNFPLLGLSHIAVYNEDGVDYLRRMERVDCLFLDPARRNVHGEKSIALADCEPNVSLIEDLLLEKADRIMIKLSPMLDLTQALRELKHAEEAHIVSVHNEVKELLLILGGRSIDNIPIHCVNLTTGRRQSFSFTREQERQTEVSYTDHVETYLYEPNASILKGGAFRSIAYIYKVKKLHPNSHLYTSDKRVDNFPGRIFRIARQYAFNKKEMKTLQEEIKQANITVRNFPATVVEIRKRGKLPEGGDAYLFATTLGNEKKVLLLGYKE